MDRLTAPPLILRGQIFPELLECVILPAPNPNRFSKVSEGGGVQGDFQLEVCLVSSLEHLRLRSPPHTHMISDLPVLVIRVSEECTSGSNWYVGK